jgi:hypothetical protein
MTGWTRNLTLTTAAGAWLCVAGAAEAQNNGQPPFASSYRRPVVSPYNNLYNFSNNPLQAQQMYQQIVMPQLEQQRQQQEQIAQGRQINKVQKQVQQIQRDATTRQAVETIRPTGHASTYQNLSHFYPAGR